MADNDITTLNPDTAAVDKTVLLNRIYVKDCSFESPLAPSIFDQPFTPEVKISMRTSTRQFENHNVEVVLTITADASVDNRSVFLAEVHQAGVFTVRGFNEQENAVILASYCPSILFPYARVVIADLVMKGNMPTLVLQPVNFDAIFAQAMAAPADSKPS
jgi:preprotein translocase subunit SecB